MVKLAVFVHVYVFAARRRSILQVRWPQHRHSARYAQHVINVLAARAVAEPAASTVREGLRIHSYPLPVPFLARSMSTLYVALKSHRQSDVCC